MFPNEMFPNEMFGDTMVSASTFSNILVEYFKHLTYSMDSNSVTQQTNVHL